jgi:hypothetical protein
VLSSAAVGAEKHAKQQGPSHTAYLRQHAGELSAGYRRRKYRTAIGVLMHCVGQQKEFTGCSTWYAHWDSRVIVASA